MDGSKLTLQDGKHIKAVPCIDVVMFSHAPADKCGAGFDRFLRAFTSRYGDQLRFSRTGDMKKYRKHDKSALDGPFHWFSDPAVLGKNMLGFQAHAGDVAKNFLPPAIELALTGFFDPPAFRFRIVLPLEVADAPDDLATQIQDALSDFPLTSGYCGYSLAWERTDYTIWPEVYPWSAAQMRRHPGLNYGEYVTTSNPADDGIVVVSWLTCLGKGLVDDLGGREAVSVHRLS